MCKLKVQKFEECGGQQDDSDGKGRPPLIHTYMHTTHMPMREKTRNC